MLISVALDPACFIPEEIRTAEERAGAERILEAVTDNAVLVASAVDPFIDELLGAVTQLDVRMGEQIQLTTVEIAKNRARFIATPRRTDTARGEARIHELRRIALELRADIVIVRDNAADLTALADLPTKGIEVCTPSGYRGSRAEARRKQWLSAQRLDSLEVATSGELLGRAIMYAEEILILDKMIARAVGKDGRVTSQLSRFARGIIHVARQWQMYSPLAAYHRPSIVIVSSAGQCGASTGFVDPIKAEKAIRAALVQADPKRMFENITVDLRQDSKTPVFKDRFLAGFGRCWSISHGLDDIGNLSASKEKRSPTVLVPDCQTYRDILADIKRLPKAPVISV